MRSSDWSSDVGASDLKTARRSKEGGLKGRLLARRSKSEIVFDLAVLDLEFAVLQEGVADKHVPVAVHQFFGRQQRTEENTSELQSLMSISYPVFCLKNKIILLYIPLPTCIRSI